MIRIEPVEGRARFREFIRLPGILYGGAQGYVPPLETERRALMDPETAGFFRDGEAGFWMALRDGRPVGRISAQIDRRISPSASAAVAANAVGMFGNLDAADDAEAVAALIGAARDWLAGRGMARMRGPFTLSINGETGLQVADGQCGPMVMMPWHPPHLPQLVLQAGLEPVRDVVSYAFDLGARTASPAGLDRLRGRDISVRGLRVSDPDGEAAIMSDIFNDAWRDNWGFVPLEAAQLSGMARAMRPLLGPDNVVVIEIGGRPMAFGMVLPNLYEMITGFGGRLMPFNWARLLWRARRRQFRSVRLLLFGVRATLRHSVLGAMLPAFILAELAARARRYRIETLEAGWVLEDNHAVRGLIERNGGILTRRHRIYECALGQAPRP